jgi:hypothetical protein
MIHRTLLTAGAIIAFGVITACSDTTGPKPLASDTGSSESSPRSGALHVMKECTEYTRLAGSFCTITSSNLKQIEVGTKVIYAIASGPTRLDSDVILDLPGSGNSTAYGHVVLDFLTLQGVVTISGGTGKFEHFQASVVVSHLVGRNWAWDGTYSFEDRD